MITLMVAACVMPVAAGDSTADILGKSLAQLFLAKEENVPAAKHSMGLFQVQQHFSTRNRFSEYSIKTHLSWVCQSSALQGLSTYMLDIRSHSSAWQAGRLMWHA